MRDMEETFEFGQLFELTGSSGLGGFYILTAWGHGKFALVNLIYGSKMSEPTKYNHMVKWADIMRHIDYFTRSGQRSLLPLTKATMQYRYKPSTLTKDQLKAFIGRA